MSLDGACPIAKRLRQATAATNFGACLQVATQHSALQDAKIGARKRSFVGAVLFRQRFRLQEAACGFVALMCLRECMMTSH